MVRGADYLGKIRMGLESITVKDTNGQDYVVSNPQSFLQHLIQYHDVNRWPNGSTHVENGRTFYITKSFFNNVQSKVNSFKFK